MFVVDAILGLVFLLAMFIIAMAALRVIGTPQVHLQHKPKPIEPPKPKSVHDLYLEHCLEQDRLFKEGDTRGIYGDYTPKEL